MWFTTRPDLLTHRMVAINDTPPPTRSRRKSARPSEIVQAALAEFAAKGYGATRLIDVARRAGIAKGTIYLYFDTKQALFEACILAEVTPMIGGIETLIDTYEGASDVLLQMMLTRAYSELVQSDARVLLRIIMGEGHLFPELRRLHYEMCLQRGLAALQRVIDRGIARGEFREGASREYPKLVMAPCIAAAMWQLSFDDFDPLDLDRYMAGHLDLMMNGIRT